MLIDIWSDVVCPWCFIGRRRLEKALAGFPYRDEVVLRHRAFQLQPDLREILPTGAHLAEKYNMKPEKVNEMRTNLRELAKGEDLNFSLADTFSGNTFDAHRLLLWADGLGMQDRLLEEMYSAYFEKSLPLFSHQDLLHIVDSLGIDRGLAQNILESNEFGDKVREDGEIARALGATGVPFYVLNMKFGISGAQPVEIFAQTLARAWSEESKSNGEEMGSR